MEKEQQGQAEREIEASLEAEREIAALLEEWGFVELAPQTWADRAPSLRFFLDPDWRAGEVPAEEVGVEIGVEIGPPK